jgi:hypothetical protein
MKNLNPTKINIVDRLFSTIAFKFGGLALSVREKVHNTGSFLLDILAGCAEQYACSQPLQSVFISRASSEPIKTSILTAACPSTVHHRF